LVDLNTASVGTLNALGIGLVGRRVVANRPYAQTDDLLLKRILTRKDFEQIRTKVTAR
jgi:DNA uptake protein ComE-like DNA-binding protein